MKFLVGSAGPDY